MLTVALAATVELTKTPLDKLERIEKRQKDPDADVAARARRVIAFVLKSNIDLRRTRFELRAVAPLEVMKKWVGAGADPKAPPPGYLLVRYADKAIKGLEKVSIKQAETGLEIAGFLAADDIDVILLRQTLRDLGYRLAPKK